MFFSCRGAKRGWAGVPASASLQSGAQGHVQADRTSIFFWSQVNVRRCREIRSNSKNDVRRCDHFSVIFWPIFGHIDSVKLTSLKIIRKGYFFDSLTIEEHFTWKSFNCLIFCNFNCIPQTFGIAGEYIFPYSYFCYVTIIQFNFKFYVLILRLVGFLGFIL